ncbi:hypothetical protein ILUMI_07273 [Ignelater luminosus]|uniref:Uncharacterized protein n=1 Tax=Ignelater luminosus TaxID=2038154 RepID=A0A8K0GGH0_IGNLU|nr:hypothetical protein ILUMI_07273 [Ignelater luminosus]
MALVRFMVEFDPARDDWVVSQERLEQYFAANFINGEEGTKRRVATLLMNSESSFPAAMWAEQSRTGKWVVEGASRYELWMGEKPRIKHLRIIGSAFCAHILAQRRRKIDKKAIKERPNVGKQSEDETSLIYLGTKEITESEKEISDCEELEKDGEESFQMLQKFKRPLKFEQAREV